MKENSCRGRDHEVWRESHRGSAWQPEHQRREGKVLRVLLSGHWLPQHDSYYLSSLNFIKNQEEMVWASGPGGNHWLPPVTALKKDLWLMLFLFISQVFPAVTNDFLFHSLLTLNLNKWEWGTGRPVQENGVGGGWWATANSKLKEFAPHRPHQDPLLGSSPPKTQGFSHDVTPWSALKEFILDEPTWRCHQNPFVGALGIQEPVILGEPQIKG